MPLAEWSSKSCPIIGMLHALPLPGSPGFTGDFSAVREVMLRDAEALVSGGVDGLMLENYGDVPFFPDRVPSITVAALASLATDLRRQFPSPLGIPCLRNDGRSALSVAVVCDASFIRVNVLCGARVADQGVLQGIAHDLLRERSQHRANSIQIWADVDVKHSAPLASRSLSDEVHDLVDRGGADAVIVSGTATGSPVDLKSLQIIKQAAGSTPVLIGSGVTPDSMAELAPLANGVIVGSSLKQEGRARNPVDIERVKRLVDAVNRRN